MSKLKILLENIKFAHTIFALPFAYMGMLLAARGLPTFGQFFWITAAMASARTLAMSANRLIDAEVDARNARTANRPLPQGRISRKSVLAVIILSGVLLFFSAWQLNVLCLLLAPLALLFLIGYSYTKRFTWLSHWVLGITDGAAAAGGWIAVTGAFELSIILLWLAVALWIGGFDVIYACQDVDFDRREGLYSVPAQFGVAVALRWARLSHVFTALVLLTLGLLMHMGLFYWLGWLITAALLAYENSLVHADDLSKLNVAFFNVNGYIAVVIFAATLLNYLL